MEVFVVVILHLSMFFIHNFFLTSFVTLPWTIARFLHPFCTFSPVHRRMIRDFIFRPFHDLLTASATVLSGHFLPTSVFYLTLLLDIFGTTCLYQGFLGSQQLFLESCRASSKHRPGRFVCLIHSNPQSFIHLKFVFMHVNIAKVLLVVKTLIRSAATLFSSHENIKQQPN